MYKDHTKSSMTVHDSPKVQRKTSIDGDTMRSWMASRFSSKSVYNLNANSIKESQNPNKITKVILLQIVLQIQHDLHQGITKTQQHNSKM